MLLWVQSLPYTNNTLWRMYIGPSSPALPESLLTASFQVLMMLRAVARGTKTFQNANDTSEKIIKICFCHNICLEDWSMIIQIFLRCYQYYSNKNWITSHSQNKWDLFMEWLCWVEGHKFGIKAHDITCTASVQEQRQPAIQTLTSVGLPAE